MKRNSTPILFLMTLLSLNVLYGQTVDITAPCLGTTFSFVLDDANSPDASGRNVYFYAQASIEIAFNTELARWEVRARGGNFDVYYHNDFASAPNPPDNMTSAWEDNAICDGTGLPTVAGDGTQSTLTVDPCAELGGDTDLDGICDDEDPNPTVPNGILVTLPCINDGEPLLLTLDGQDAIGRNIYANKEGDVEYYIAYGGQIFLNDEWELYSYQEFDDGGNSLNILARSAYASYPNPPASSIGNWEVFTDNCTGGTAGNLSITGTDTQSILGCAMFIPFVDIITTPASCGMNGSLSITPQDNRGVILYELTGPVNQSNNTGVFESLPVGDYAIKVIDTAFPRTDISACLIDYSFFISGTPDTEMPEITCPEDISVNVDAGQCGAVVTYATPVGTDNCPMAATTMTAGLESGASFPAGQTMVTYTVTDGNNNSADCSFNVTVTDAEMPTALCRDTLSVAIDTGGLAILSAAMIDLGSADLCGDVMLSIDRDSLTCDDLGEQLVTLLVTDEAGLTNSCSTTVSITDANAICNPNSLRDWLSGPEPVYQLPVFPNPAREQINIDLSALDTDRQAGELRIYNTLGQIVFRKACGPDQRMIHTINTEAMAAGTYIVQFQTATRLVGANRMIVQR